MLSRLPVVVNYAPGPPIANTSGFAGILCNDSLLKREVKRRIILQFIGSPSHLDGEHAQGNLHVASNL